MKPEFGSRSNADFIRMTAEDTALRRRIIGIVVDQAHFSVSFRCALMCVRFSGSSGGGGRKLPVQA